LKTAVVSEVFVRGVVVSLARGWAAVAAPTSRSTALAAAAAKTVSLRRKTPGP
jgi:hypothetical protein